MGAIQNSTLMETLEPPAIAAPSALIGIQESEDPCRFERASQPWEVLATPLAAGPFGNHKTFLATPNCILYRESFASRLRVRALSPEGMLTLLVPVRWGGGTSYFNRPPQHGRQLPIMLPGCAEATFDAGHQHVIVLIRLTLLRRLLLPEQVAGLTTAAARHFLAASPLRIKRLGRWLEGILARTHGAPQMLRHVAAVETLERELVLGLVCMLPPPITDTLPARAALRRRGLDRAAEHIRHADLTTLNLAALCTAAGVSQRTLEYAFQENLGLSPMAFVRQLRMHGLRRELLASRLGEASVTDVAFHLGFTQLGRLSGDYRRTFGELPSGTLARTFDGDVPPFCIEGVTTRSRATTQDLR